ncbi:MAG: hypothetical protein GC191_01590 [Azospirillum sp.]|nr:hypothetical protein [Azospirillum sp.]
MGYFVAFAVGFTLLVSAGLNGHRRIAAAKARVATAIARKQAQVERIRRLAKATLGLRRQLRTTKFQLDSLGAACKGLEADLAKTEAVDRRLYILDDRRSANDLTWIVLVRNSKFADMVDPRAALDTIGSWRKGRRFLVWAPTDKRAAEKTWARYPEVKGFAIQSVVVLPQPERPA